MATRSLSSVKVSCKLNNGHTASGSVKTVSVSIGAIEPGYYNSDKAFTIASALSSCLDKTLVRVEETQGASLLGN